MKLYSTYPASKSVSTQSEYDDTIRICYYTMHYNTTLVDIIGGAFLKAQLLYDEEIITDRPFRLRIVVPEDSLKKYKDEDSNNAMERIEWYVANALPPPNGIIVDIFTSDKINPYVETPWAMNRLWSAKRQWQRNEKSNYVTMNFPDGSIADWKSTGTRSKLRRIEELVLTFGLDIKHISYKTDIEEAAKLMLGSRCHFTYIGGTYSQAAFLGVPTISIGKPRKNVDMSADPKTGEVSKELVNTSMYGYAQICASKIPKYDPLNKMVRNGPVSILHIKNNDPIDLETKLQIVEYIT